MGMTTTDADEGDDAPLPPLIGPHEGREVELMLAGEKPLAYFYAFVDEPHIIPDAEFEPYVRDGTLVKREWTVDLPPDGRDLSPFRHVLLALPAETWRIEAAFKIIDGHARGIRKYAREDNARMGRLLGYPEEAIAFFVDRCEEQRHAAFERLAMAADD